MFFDRKRVNRPTDPQVANTLDLLATLYANMPSVSQSHFPSYVLSPLIFRKRRGIRKGDAEGKFEGDGASMCLHWLACPEVLMSDPTRSGAL